MSNFGVNMNNNESLLHVSDRAKVNFNIMVTAI